MKRLANDNLLFSYIAVTCRSIGPQKETVVMTPAALNSGEMKRLATDALMDLGAAAKTTEFYPLPVRRVNLRDGTGDITSHESARSRPNSLSTNFERRSKSETIESTTSLIPSTVLPPDQLLL
jgi:hypothetical protein